MSETRCHEVQHDRDDPATRRDVSVLSLGAMLIGSRTDEATSFAILDRYVEAGGTFIDTSGNYAFWVNGTQGGESEEPLGRSGPYRASAQARWPGSGLGPVPRMPHEPRTPRHPRPQDRTRARTRHGNRSDGTWVWLFWSERLGAGWVGVWLAVRRGFRSVLS
jgi:hypothetical protein